MVQLLNVAAVLKLKQKSRCSAGEALSTEFESGQSRGESFLNKPQAVIEIVSPSSATEIEGLKNFRGCIDVEHVKGDLWE